MPVTTINPQCRASVVVRAGCIARVVGDAAAVAQLYYSINFDGLRGPAVAANDVILIGPYAQNVVLMCDVALGHVTIDDDWKPAAEEGEPAVRLDQVNGVGDAVSLINARLSAAQRSAIDALDGESTAAEIVAALQATEE